MEAIDEGVLDLVLKKEPFDLMERGVKNLEYRNGSLWMAVRLVGKKYSYIKFRNGYQPNAPYFICRYVGYVVSQKDFSVQYSTGFRVDVKPGDYIIVLGKIVERGNIINQ